MVASVGLGIGGAMPFFLSKFGGGGGLEWQPTIEEMQQETRNAYQFAVQIVGNVQGEKKHGKSQMRIQDL